MRFALIAAAGLLLAGCQEPWPPQTARSNAQPLPGMPGSPIPPKYCYRTLVAVDCHSAPLNNEHYRLLGYEGPPPAKEGFAVGGRPGS